MSFIEYLNEKFDWQETDSGYPLLTAKMAEQYAQFQVRRAIQSIIDYELENGRTPICNDEQRGAVEYAQLFFDNY